MKATRATTGFGSKTMECRSVSLPLAAAAALPSPALVFCVKPSQVLTSTLCAYSLPHSDYNIRRSMNEFTRVRDEDTMTQYMFGATGMVSYDDERAICDKTEYAQVHDLNGYIIWELSGDMNEDGSTPLLDAANAKLLNPDMDCASLDQSDEVMSEDMQEVSVPERVFYPDFGRSKCLSDGVYEDMFKPEKLFDSAQRCCHTYFSSNEFCVQKSEEANSAESKGPASMGALYYPSSLSNACLSDGKQPEWLPKGSIHDTAEACCETHYGFSQDCIRDSDGSTTAAATVAAPVTFTNLINATFTAKVTTAATTKVTTTAATTAATTAVHTPPKRNTNNGFFPAFIDGTTRCENVGTPPSWMTRNILSQTKSECCQNYAFPWDHEKCLTGFTSDSPASSASVDYYPDFEAITCKVDGKHPDWMAGDYFAETLTRCCSESFPDQEVHRQCRPICPHCPSYWNDPEATETAMVKAGAEFCPGTYTGRAPTSECAGYVDCTNGTPSSSIQSCPSNTQFDVVSGTCTWPIYVTCLLGEDLFEALGLDD